jgi:lipoprotein signal peptidase
MRSDSPISRPVSASTAGSVSDPVIRRYLGFAVLACLADLCTKEVAVRSLGEHGFVSLTDRFALMLVWNTGSAGGVSIGPFTTELNVLMTLLAMGLVFTVVRPMAAIDPRATLPLALVSGGAAGNLLSMLWGPSGVADFIGIRLTKDTTIVANVADFALWTGALLLAPVVLTLVRMVRAERAQAALVSSVG